MSPLHYAARYDRCDIMRLLIENKAGIYEIFSFGRF